VPKVQSDIGAVASAFKEFFAWFREWSSGSEVRNLKSAARHSQLYMKRVEKIYPKAKKDKTLRAHKRKFERFVI